MAANKLIYIVTHDDRNSCIDPIGVFDRKGLLNFLREQKRKAQWNYYYEVDDKGHQKFIKRVKSYPQLKVVSHALNKTEPGTIYYEWYLLK